MTTNMVLTSSMESFFQLIVALIAFILVLALTYITTRFLGNFQKNVSKGTNFEPIETFRLSNTKYLEILRVGERYVVIAVCKDTVTAVMELDKDEIQIPEYKNSKDTFAKILERMRKKEAEQGQEEQKDDDDKEV